MTDRDAQLAEQVAMWDQANALLDRIIGEVRPATDRTATATDQQ